MCFITVEDIDERLRKPDYARVLGEMLRLELAPEGNDDTWPCISAVLCTGRVALLWTVFARGKARDDVSKVLADFNETLG